MTRLSLTAEAEFTTNELLVYSYFDGEKIIPGCFSSSALDAAACNVPTLKRHHSTAYFLLQNAEAFLK